MSASPQGRDFFVGGGTVKPSSPSYVERRADRELLERLEAGDFCYVLTPRQMGKSSLMARTAERLRAKGAKTAVVDLTVIGEGRPTDGQQRAGVWYLGLASEVTRSLGVSDGLREWWADHDTIPQQQRFMRFLEEIVLGRTEGAIVIFVDEIDATIRLPFADDFFAGVRAIYNARAANAVWTRLSFALFGVASPSELIKDPTRTPFNIGHRIELTDFTVDEARALAAGLPLTAGDARRTVEQIHEWTGGQPFLTQALCIQISNRLPTREGLADGVVEVDRLIAAEISSKARGAGARIGGMDVHFGYIAARLVRDPRSRDVLRTYRRILKGDAVRDDKASPAKDALKLAGLVAQGSDGNLHVRNRIYERVFDGSWVREVMPPDRTRRIAVGASVAFALIAGLIVLYRVLTPDEFVFIEPPAEFVFLNGTEPHTLDPHLATGRPEWRILEAMFDGLTVLDAETMTPRAGCAKSWTVSPDGRIWTFSIRPEARWSNGVRVTAHDFVYSWKRLQTPEIASEYAYLLHCVRHARAFNTYRRDLQSIPAFVAQLGDPREMATMDWRSFVRKLRPLVQGTTDEVLIHALERREGGFTEEEVRSLQKALKAEMAKRDAAYREAEQHFGFDEGVFAKDDRTLVVELVGFTPYFLELTAMPFACPVLRGENARPLPDAMEGSGTFISNGPFEVDEWMAGKGVRLTKRSSYWNAEKIHLRSIDAVSFDDSTEQLAAFASREAHWVPAAHIQQGSGGLTGYYRVPSGITYFYRFNCTKAPFDDARVRWALGLAIDRDRLCRDVLKGRAIPAARIVPPGMPGYASPRSEYRLDVEQARRLMADAGYPEGKGFPRASVLFNTLEQHEAIAQYVTRGWKDALGIEVTLHNQEWQSYQDDVLKLRYDIARAGWIAEYSDPATFLGMWITEGENNQTGWSNPLYDRIIRMAADPEELLAMDEGEMVRFLDQLKERESDFSAVLLARNARGPDERLSRLGALRLQLLREAEAILIQDEFPIVPLYVYVSEGLLSPRVRGFFTEIMTSDGRMLPNLLDVHPLRALRVDPASK